MAQTKLTLFIGYSPLVYKMIFREMSLERLDEWCRHAKELPDAYRAVLLDEYAFKAGCRWVHA